MKTILLPDLVTARRRKQVSDIRVEQIEGVFYIVAEHRFDGEVKSLSSFKTEQDARRAWEIVAQGPYSAAEISLSLAHTRFEKEHHNSEYTTLASDKPIHGWFYEAPKNPLKA
ncbi:hypothetical protein [Thaumasiovibrio subtropicus]|uniref:hypothetical protein n=1 Tax=Thaumasiovibrio subtropicus TaxID=1891207 RepID=UPI000B35B25D|nr:hypothetical protein [Thaumasiovibrio subtropicus]